MQYRRDSSAQWGRLWGNCLFRQLLPNLYKNKGKYRGKLREYAWKYGQIDNILLKSRKTNLCTPSTAPCALQREWLSFPFTTSSGVLYGPVLSSQVSDPKTKINFRCNFYSLWLLKQYSLFVLVTMEIIDFLWWQESFLGY